MMMDRAAFFDAARPIFGDTLTEAQVRGMEGILDAFAEVGDGRAKTLRDVLTTPTRPTNTGRRAT